MEVFDGLLDEVAVAIANMAELGRGNAHEQHAFADIAVACGLKPGVEGLAIDLFFERGEDLYPRIESDRRSNGERHAQSSCDKRPEVGSRPAAPRSRNAKMPEVNPGVWNQGEFRSRSVLAGSGSDLSRIGASVKFFRQPQSVEKILSERCR